MIKNIGSTDKIIRVVVALVFAGLIATGAVGSPWSWILGALALIFVATSFIGTCPLYMPFKFSTRKN